MSGALYRKYRSRSFDDVVGQQHITTTLVNSIKKGSFAHAYLLTGPRGVGKTSVARLFAYSVNGLGYEDSKTYSDIIEIDAASNRRIDEIRELREKISIAPSLLKYKVYIIDEVHMLTKEAFNALLKTLEEPPEHAIFILATTDFQKVPDTIVSRCVRLTFSAISQVDIKKHLQKIAKEESISIESEALDIIADNAGGSFRDAISLLDQFRSSGSKVTAEYVTKVLGISPYKMIKKLVEALEQSKPKQLIETLDELRASGAADDQIIKQLTHYLRNCLVDVQSTKLNKEQLVSLAEALLRINNYSDMRLSLDIALLNACGSQPKPPAPETFIEEPEIIENPIDEGPVDPPIVEAVVLSEPPIASVPMSGDLWQSMLESLKSSNSTLYGIARMAETKQDKGELELYFKFPFHLKQMKTERNYMLLEKLAKSMDDKIQKVTISLKEGSRPAPATTKKPTDAPVKNISNIFGPSEVLES